MPKRKSELFLNPKTTLTFNQMWNFHFEVEITIAISVFFATNINIQNALSYHNTLYNQANRVLNKYNIKCNHLTFESKPLDFREKVYLPDQVKDLRGKAHLVYDDQVDDKKKIQRIPIIYANAADSIPYSGQTFRDLGWLPFVLIYPNNDNIKDNITLLHEIGHCAGLDHNVRNDSTKIEDIMMTSEAGFDKKITFTPWQRFNIGRIQADHILKSYFSTV